jgi:hypothetical protein
MLQSAIPYLNDKGNCYLENQVIKDLIQAKDNEGSDYYGVLSWKFRSKTYNQISEPQLDQAARTKADVIGIWGKVKAHNVWTHPVKLNWHPKEFLECGKYIVEKIYGVDVETMNTPIIYSNHQIVKSELYTKYVDEFLAPAMDLMSTDEYLVERLNVNANYNTITKGEIASEETCMRIFNKPFYTLHPFVCERFFSTFASIHNLTIYQI